jgi:membrane-associated phospholipid phosphatase
MKKLSTSSALFQNTLLSLIPTALLITLCYFWADPAFAFWVDHENLRRFPIFDWGTHLVDVIMIWSALYYVYFAWSFSNHKKHLIQNEEKKFPWLLLNVANSVAISIFIKDAFKAPFGRYWPSTWVNNNPSLIHDHAYGFNWFHKGVIYQSFPSGHTTVAVTFMVSLWLAFPRSLWRWLGALVAFAVITGLLADDYHFIGDCIAGAWIGAVVAIYVTAARVCSTKSC